MIFALAFQFHIKLICLNARLAYCLDLIPNVKALGFVDSSISITITFDELLLSEDDFITQGPLLVILEDEEVAAPHLYILDMIDILDISRHNVAASPRAPSAEPRSSSPPATKSDTAITIISISKLCMFDNSNVLKLFKLYI